MIEEQPLIIHARFGRGTRPIIGTVPRETQALRMTFAIWRALGIGMRVFLNAPVYISERHKDGCGAFMCARVGSLSEVRTVAHVRTSESGDQSGDQKGKEIRGVKWL